MFSANAQQTGQFNSSVNWTNSDGSQTRSLVVYVPTNYNANTSYSLVVGFHGQGDTPANYMNSTNSVKNYATDPYFGDVIVVCPEEGPQQAWFYGDEDFGIIKAIRDEINNTYNIDYNRVFAQGFSFGGKSAFLHGLAEADDVAGILAFSPAFYGDEDVNNACVSANCNNGHHDFNYANASKLKVCTSAGGGPGYYEGAAPSNPSEGYMTPLASQDQTGATVWDSFLGLAIVAKDKINSYASGNASFKPSENTSHSLPPLTISKQCWTFVQPVVTSVEVNAIEKNINIFPNPATDVINVFLVDVEGIKEITLVNVLGDVIYSNINVINNNTIDVSNQPKGVYFVRIKTENQLITKKVVLTK